MDRSGYKTIDAETFAKLKSGAYVLVMHGRCELRGPGSYGDRFIMTGPSGYHSIDASVTDLERLNAHWQGFHSDPINIR